MTTAAAALAALQQQAGQARDLASLEASQEELQRAAQACRLVARSRPKLFTGERLPALDPTHRILDSAERPVTTQKRRDASRRYKHLKAYVEGIQGTITRLPQRQRRPIAP